MARKAIRPDSVHRARPVPTGASGCPASVRDRTVGSMAMAITSSRRAASRSATVASSSRMSARVLADCASACRSAIWRCSAAT